MTLHAPKPSRPHREYVGTCAICDRKLIHPGRIVPCLGMLGPECEHKVGDFLTHLQGNGLGDLILTGVARIECVRAANGMYEPPLQALALSKAAKRLGLLTLDQYEPGQPPHWVVRLKPSSVVAYFKRPAVQA